MSLTSADLYPVARYGRHDWLLIRKGEEPQQVSFTQEYFKYDALRKLWDDPRPLQVWCKYIDFEWLTDLDKEYFAEAVEPGMLETEPPQQPMYRPGELEE